MSISLFVAKRYFFSPFKASFITLISRISMIGVGVEVMALVLILSVFNGLEDFQIGLFKTFDPDLTIISKSDTRFSLTATQFNQLAKISGVSSVQPILEDQALIRYNGRQLVVTLKGIDSSFISSRRLREQVVDGDYLVENEGNTFGMVGAGVFMSMGMNFDDVFHPVEVWYPNQKALAKFQINENAANLKTFFPSGVLQVEQMFDNQMILVPLPWMRELTLADSNSVSKVDVMLTKGANELDVQKAIQPILGTNYQVQTRNQQHAILLRAIKIEKLFVFILMAFIMGIASFTLFYALSLLVIEKRKDLRTLLAMGITQQQLLRIFLSVGLFISFSGALVGMALGFALGWIQQTFGIVPLGIPNALIDSYPVKMEWFDFLMTALVVIILTFLASIIPARKAVQMTFNQKVNQPKAD
ncbi:ABC transporter permease [Aquirufa sp.]|jgi:lipoprotein-releasing system permease protein|uniref:ABC transporter permease n=1 Tax=Aquirufa sp. TaxID=2676249 RepID=UPI003784101A